MARGGLAGAYAYKTLEESCRYTRDVYRIILTRDLVQKYALYDTQMLERLSEYMMDNSGNLNSPNNITNVLAANRVSSNHVTVGKYISYLRRAFVFYEARRYDIRGKVPRDARETLYLRFGIALRGHRYQKHGLGAYARDRRAP